MTKLVVLSDPSNMIGADRIFRFCYQHKKEIEEKCEFWVGCSSSHYSKLSYLMKRLKDTNFDERVLFPGLYSHALSGKYATHIFRPELLNSSRQATRIYIYLGKILSDILYLPAYVNFKLQEFTNNIFGINIKSMARPDFWECGYLILYKDTKVGRATGAIDIDDESAIAITKNYLAKNPECYGIYLEGGSGFKRPVTERSQLMSEMKRMTKGKVFIAGGGIKNEKDFKKSLDIGVDKIVVGTHFENYPKDILEFSRLI